MRRMVVWLAVIAVTVAFGMMGCSSDKTTPTGGLMVVIRSDGSLPALTRLHIAVTSVDGATTYRGADYSMPDEATLPTTLAIASNGSATASVAINVSVWAGTTALDVRDRQIFEVPTDRVAELDVVLSAKCTRWVQMEGNKATSTCPGVQTCDPTSGMCVDERVHAAGLPTYEGGGTTTDGGGHTMPDGGGNTMPDGGGGDGDATSDGGMQTAEKVDILFAIDNSASMGDKQLLLAQAVPDLLSRLITPNCVDDAGNATGGTASTDGKCSGGGKPEFMPVHDMHIGIVSSSLGGRGANICDGSDTDVGTGQVRHDDDKGHLLGRASTVTPTYPNLPTSIGDEQNQGHPTPNLEPSNYLGWLPDVPANTGKSDPAAVKDATQLIKDFEEAIGGVHEYGCGIEAQLESWYRFLIQPDPYLAIVQPDATSNRRDLSGTDSEILKQRHDFLRPDSLVAIILLSDEDDSAADPRAVSGQGSAYANTPFPGKNMGPTHVGAARGTSACDNVDTINTDACTSCGFGGNTSDSNCVKSGDGQAGYYSDAEDGLNTRFVRMKQRYGVDPQFPIRRYVNGLKSVTVPDRRGEVYNGPGNTYNATNNCRNPLYAKDLPTNTNGDLCNLTPGPRTANLVFFAAITGVPWQLLTEHPEARGGEGNFLSTIGPERWKLIIGNDPNKYDYGGMDPHMIQSQDPRPGLAGVTSSDTTDTWHGREWDTGKLDLQYACTFQLPARKDCTDAKYKGACDCGGTLNPPLCDAANKNVQTRGKAYPGIRQLTVARDMGDHGIAASLCPRSLEQSSADYGYRPAVRALVARMAKSLQK